MFVLAITKVWSLYYKNLFVLLALQKGGQNHKLYFTFFGGFFLFGKTKSYAFTLINITNYFPFCLQDAISYGQLYSGWTIVWTLSLSNQMNQSTCTKQHREVTFSSANSFLGYPLCCPNVTWNVWGILRWKWWFPFTYDQTRK